MDSSTVDEANIRRRAFLFVSIGASIALWLFMRQANSSLNYNESHNLLYAVSRSPAELLKIDDMHPPGFYLFMHFWQKIAGQSEILLRMPSLVFAILSIVLVYLIGKKLYSEKVAILGVLLFAVSPMQIAASTTLRPYSLLTLAFLISLLCFINILKENRTSYHGVNSAATFTALFLHYYGVFLPAYQFAYLLLTSRQRKSQLKKWLLFQSVVALLYLPFAYIAATYQLQMVNPMGGARILTVPGFINSIYAMSPLGQSFHTAITPWVVFVMLLFAGLLVIGTLPIKENALLGEYLVLPIIIVAVVSNIAGLKFFQSYHFTFLLPAFALLTARGLLKLGKPGLVAASFIAALSLITPLENRNPDWKACSLYLKHNTRQGDSIIIFPELNDGLLYYWPRASIIPFDEIKAKQNGPRRIWAVFVYEGIYSTLNATDLMTEWLKQSGFSVTPVNGNIENVKLFLVSR